MLNEANKLEITSLEDISQFIFDHFRRNSKTVSKASKMKGNRKEDSEFERVLKILVMRTINAMKMQIHGLRVR